MGLCHLNTNNKISFTKLFESGYKIILGKFVFKIIQDIFSVLAVTDSLKTIGTHVLTMNKGKIKSTVS